MTEHLAVLGSVFLVGFHSTQVDFPAYARSKSGLEIPRFQVLDPVESPCGQVTIAVPGDGRSLAVAWVHPYFVGSVGLSLESASQCFQLPAQFSVGHAATVRVPLGLRRGVTSGGSASPSSLQS